MIGFLKRIFGRKRKMKKFDIVKEVLNADGSSRQVMENGVIAFNRKQLVEMYDSCGERIINILKEYSDDDSQKAGKPRMYSKDDVAAIKNEMEHMRGAHGEKISTASLDNLLNGDNVAFVGGNGNHTEKPVQTAGGEIVPSNMRKVPFRQLVSPKPAPVQVVEKKPPKYFKIGGVEVKEDNGKIFQKQWCIVPITEMHNYRIVIDSSNKIVSMNGKHIEVKKWVQVEDSGDEDVAMEPDPDSEGRPAAVPPDEPESEKTNEPLPEAPSGNVSIEVVPNKTEEGKLING